MTKKAKPPVLPDEVWVQAFHTHTAVGSVSHVGYGEKFFATREDCLRDIDEMDSWPGMGDRKKYRPLKLVNGYKVQVD
jgi:hypothetical protein